MDSRCTRARYFETSPAIRPAGPRARDLEMHPPAPIFRRASPQLFIDAREYGSERGDFSPGILRKHNCRLRAKRGEKGRSRVDKPRATLDERPANSPQPLGHCVCFFNYSPGVQGVSDPPPCTLQIFRPTRRIFRVPRRRVAFSHSL